ncbi:MAG TPA: hypothetical protein VLA49_11095 [Anaerolineales bacterium]|nr:hypothetical protein [Anaerolineales bacterium]
MNLIPNEKILLESDNKELVLTTHRVRHTFPRRGELRLTSLTLDALQSCELRRVSSPMWLYLAGISFLLGIVLYDDSPAFFIAGLILAAISVYAYYATQRQVLRLASAGGAIVADVQGLTQQALLEFIDAVETAKADLLLYLHSQ